MNNVNLIKSNIFNLTQINNQAAKEPIPIQFVLKQALSNIEGSILKGEPLKKEYNFFVKQDEGWLNLKINNTLRGLFVSNYEYINYERGKKQFPDFPDKPTFIKQINHFAVLKITESPPTSFEKDSFSFTNHSNVLDKIKLPDVFKKGSLLENITLSLLRNYNLDKGFIPDSSAHYVIAWSLITDHVLKSDLPLSEKIEFIEKYRIGKILSECKGCLKPLLSYQEISYLNLHLIGLAYNLIELMSEYYSEKGQWHREHFDLKHSTIADTTLKKCLTEAAQKFSNQKINTFIFAKELLKPSSENESIINITKSGRLWGIYKKDQVWAKNASEWQTLLPAHTIQLTKLHSNLFAFKAMEKILFSYVQWAKKYDYKSNLLKHPLTKSNFARELRNFLNERDTKVKCNNISTIRSLFHNAFTVDQWSIVEGYVEKGQIAELSNYIENLWITDEQAIAMYICCLSCGEIKIALDKCRQFAEIPSNDSLSSKLQFLALKHINPSELKPIDICKRCHDFWPVMEALNWMVNRSGLELEIFESI